MYDRDVAGTVVNVKGLVFYNTVTKKQEMDHAYKNGRPCLIIYSDDEYEYFLTMTSRSNVEKYDSHITVLDSDYLCKYLYPACYKGINREELKKEYVCLQHVYKMKIWGHGQGDIGKLKFYAYKNIIEKLKAYHRVDDIKEFLENESVLKR